MLFTQLNGRERPATDSSEVDVLQNVACGIGPAVDGIRAPQVRPQAMGAFVTVGAQSACAGRVQEQHTPTTMPGLGQVAPITLTPTSTPAPTGTPTTTGSRFALTKASILTTGLQPAAVIEPSRGTSTPTVPSLPPLTSTPGTHPPGSITAFSPKLNMWRVAFPIGALPVTVPVTSTSSSTAPTSSFTPAGSTTTATFAPVAGLADAFGLGQTTHTEQAPQVAPDPADTQVSERELEKKTGQLPIYKNPLFWLAVAGGIVLLGGGFYFVRRRRRAPAAAVVPAPAPTSGFGMTKAEAVQQFNDLYPPETFRRPSGYIDRPMRREAWNNFTDMLAKDRQITMKQYNEWTHPWRD